MPNPYAILGALVVMIGLVIGAFYAGYSWENDRWIAAVAQQKQDAADLLAAATKRANDAEAKNAANELSQQKDATDHAAEITAKDTQLAGLAQQLDSLRSARRGISSSSAVPASAKSTTGNSGGSAAVSGPTPGSYGDLAAIEASALASAAYADSCYAWAKSIAPDPKAVQQ